jgi:hypothetical protein
MLARPNLDRSSPRLTPQLAGSSVTSGGGVTGGGSFTSATSLSSAIVAVTAGGSADRRVPSQGALPAGAQRAPAQLPRAGSERGGSPPPPSGAGGGDAECGAVRISSRLSAAGGLAATCSGASAGHLGPAARAPSGSSPDPRGRTASLPAALRSQSRELAAAAPGERSGSVPGRLPAHQASFVWGHGSPGPGPSVLRIGSGSFGGAPSPCAQARGLRASSMTQAAAPSVVEEGAEALQVPPIRTTTGAGAAGPRAELGPHAWHQGAPSACSFFGADAKRPFTLLLPTPSPDYDPWVDRGMETASDPNAPGGSAAVAAALGPGRGSFAGLPVRQPSDGSLASREGAGSPDPAFMNTSFTVCECCWLGDHRTSLLG